MKKILALSLSLIVAISTFGALCLNASAEDTNFFEVKHQVVTCKMGNHYTGNFEFLSNNTSTQEGNPFVNPDIATEANGKFLVVEVTLEELRAINGACPNPDEVTLCIAALSDGTEWEDSCNGYPNFRGLGDTIRISTIILPTDFSIKYDDYWQFVIQLGILDETYDRLQAKTGDSFEAVVSLKSYLSDKNYLIHDNFWSTDYIGQDDKCKICGDINNDGTLDIVDVALARAYIVGSRDMSDEQINVGDMNRDGNLDIIDVVMMRKSIVDGVINYLELETETTVEENTETETEFETDIATETESETETELETTAGETVYTTAEEIISTTTEEDTESDTLEKDYYEVVIVSEPEMATITGAGKYALNETFEMVITDIKDGFYVDYIEMFMDDEPESLIIPEAVDIEAAIDIPCTIKIMVYYKRVDV